MTYENRTSHKTLLANPRHSSDCQTFDEPEPDHAPAPQTTAILWLPNHTPPDSIAQIVLQTPTIVRLLSLETMMAQIRGANPGCTTQFFVFGTKNDKFLFYSDMTNLLIENRTGKTEETVVIFKRSVFCSFFTTWSFVSSARFRCHYSLIFCHFPSKTAQEGISKGAFA